MKESRTSEREQKVAKRAGEPAKTASPGNKEEVRPTPVAALPSSSLAGKFNWLFSKTARHANALRKHVQKVLDHQRDVLSPQAVEHVSMAIANLKNTVAANADRETIDDQMEKLEDAATDEKKGLKPYPHAAWRENVEVLLVALTVAMGIRTFF